MSEGYVYILTNDRHTVLYTGSTNNLSKRLVHHKRGLVPGFSKKYNVHNLIYYEIFCDMESARQRERQIKGMSRAKKTALINAINNLWQDLPILGLAAQSQSQLTQPDPSRCASG